MHYSAAALSNCSDSESVLPATASEFANKDEGSMPDPNSDAMDTLNEPPPASEPSFWDDIQIYGVLHARQGLSDQPPDVLPSYVDPPDQDHSHPAPQSKKRSGLRSSSLLLTGD